MLIVLTGPESSGKTALARALQSHFSVPGVEEAARAYLQDRVAYLPSDLRRIALQQLDWERQVSSAAAQAGQAAWSIADTDLQVLYIWWQEKFGPAPAWLCDAYAALTPRHYLLCRPDIAWAADPLRENPHDRERLFELYRTDLERRGLAFSEISGEGALRVTNAIQAVDAIVETLTTP